MSYDNLKHEKHTINPSSDFQAPPVESIDTGKQEDLQDLYPQQSSEDYRRYVRKNQPIIREVVPADRGIDWRFIGWIGLLFPVPLILLDVGVAAITDSSHLSDPVTKIIFTMPHFVAVLIIVIAIKGYVLDRVSKFISDGTPVFWSALLFMLPITQGLRSVMASELSMGMLPPLWRLMAYSVLIAAISCASFVGFTYILFASGRVAEERNAIAYRLVVGVYILALILIAAVGLFRYLLN